MSKSTTKPTSNKTQVPRNFLLLDALKNDGKYSNISYGLVDEDDNDENLRNNYVKMEYWNCSFTYDDGKDYNFFNALCRCTLNYPKEKPKLTFLGESLLHKKIKKICDAEGNLVEKFELMTKWNETMSLGDYLSAVLNVISLS